MMSSSALCWLQATAAALGLLAAGSGFSTLGSRAPWPEGVPVHFHSKVPGGGPCSPRFLLRPPLRMTAVAAWVHLSSECTLSFRLVPINEALPWFVQRKYHARCMGGAPPPLGEVPYLRTTLLSLCSWTCLSPCSDLSWWWNCCESIARGARGGPKPPHESIAKQGCRFHLLQLHAVVCALSGRLFLVWIATGDWSLSWFSGCSSLAPLLRRRSPCWCCHQIICRVFPPILSFPLKVSFPWATLDGGSRWSPDVQRKVLALASREVVVSGELWLACLSSLLVPIPLDELSVGELTTERRSYDGWSEVQWLRFIWRVCCLVEALFGDRH
ncbi:unnamed protein product [Urochloa humidicola]